MAVSMQQVKELRDRTQAGLNDCKSALQETDGNIDAAVEIILKKGLAKSAKRAGAVAAEGVVEARVNANGTSGCLAEVNIQTDFAARNEDFKSFVNTVMTVAATTAAGADLGAQPFPGGTGTLEDARQALVGKLGENINIRRWGRIDLEGAGRVVSYVHMGGRVGVLVGAKVGSADLVSSPVLVEALENVAMQAAAMAPQFLDESQVTAEAKAKQSEIFEAQLRDEGKPEASFAKIIPGKLNKWYKEICLLPQISVLNSEKTVQELVQEAAKALGTTIEVVSFLRYERGEGIEKPQGPDYAEEVAKMAGLA